MTEPGNPARQPEIPTLFDSGIRPVVGPSQIIFYSDFSATDPADSPADTGMPPRFNAPVFTIPELGPEGNNGAVYTPTPNQPGFILSTALPPATYNIISDVPEPGALALAILGGGMLLLTLKRRPAAK